MISIAAALQHSAQLAPTSDSARLDTELLLCHVLQCTRSHLYTWPEKLLTARQQAHFEQLFNRRLNGEPVAYVLGEREFWSLPLTVSTATLIPRPATETLVAWVLDHTSSAAQQVLDLGTGTGAIALALASERPSWQLTGVDIARDAVALARHNAAKLGLQNCTFLEGRWFAPVNGSRFDVIASNPPYIDPQDPHLCQGDVRFEPRAALVAENQGLADIDEIVRLAPDYLSDHGWLCIEHGYNQADAVKALFKQQGFRQIGSANDLDDQPRITFGQRP